MNILNRLVFATATFTLSCAVFISAHQAKAATLGGTFDFQESGFILGGLDQTLTGTFSGEDINGNSILEKQELSAFRVSFTGYGIGYPFTLGLQNLESFSYDGTNLAFVATLLETFPPGPGFILDRVYVTQNAGLVIEGARGYRGGSIYSNTPPKVTKISSIPEPEENAAVLGAVGLVSFLMKKRIASTKFKKFERELEL